jgi:hypothetical protein
MSNEVVPYPSYSQKAAYPVAHSPKLPTAESAEAISPVQQAALAEVMAQADVAQQIEALEAPKFFPLVPVASAATSQVDAQAEPVIEQAQVPELAPASDVAETSETEPEVAPELAEPDAQELSPFQISGSLVLEPQTNSIVINEVPDALFAGAIVTETGEVLTTGAIEIIAPPATGEIEIIPDSPDADSPDAIDSATEFVSSVAPIRSSGVMNSKAKIGVLPGKLRKSMEHVVLATTLAVSIITVTSLLALAYMFGILR